MNSPLSERHAPWAFDLENWVSKQAIDDLLELAKNHRRQKLSDAQIGDRYLKKHPEMKHLVPILLRQGDPLGRELAFNLAKIGKTPEMLAALRDFALSEAGPDSLRLEAGLIPPGKLNFYADGNWQEILLVGSV